MIYYLSFGIIGLTVYLNYLKKRTQLNKKTGDDRHCLSLSLLCDADGRQKGKDV